MFHYLIVFFGVNIFIKKIRLLMPYGLPLLLLNIPSTQFSEYFPKITLTLFFADADLESWVSGMIPFLLKGFFHPKKEEYPMKISDSSISLRSSNLQVAFGDTAAGPTSNQSPTSPALSPAPRNPPFAALFNEKLNAATSLHTLERTNQMVAVSSKSKIVRQAATPQQIAHTKYKHYIFGNSAQTADTQWRNSLFGNANMTTRGSSLTKQLISANKGHAVEFLLKTYDGTAPYSNTFLAFLWYRENGLTLLDGQQQTTSPNPASYSLILPQFPRPAIDFNYQQMAFTSCGTVFTEDGREIEFDFSLNMTRSVLHSAASSSFGQWFELHDPLVLDLEGNGVGLTSERFSLDLDEDGTDDTLSCLEPGCGFLAYDQNQDGIINGGAELFGTVSGDGFADLAQYDSDGNNWIDENDAIFKALSIWEQNGTGDVSLKSLADSGVGAIYLDHSESSFDLHNEENNFGGRVTGSGIYLKENGEVQSIHQIDLAIEESEHQETTGDETEEAAPNDSAAEDDSEPVAL